MKRSSIVVRISGGALGASGLLYAMYSGNKIGYLVAAIGFFILTFYNISKTGSATAKS